MLRRDLLARWPATLLLVTAPAVFAADAKPIAHVGSESVSAEALSRRIAKIPDFQRVALGDSPSKLKRQVLDTFIIPDLLYAQEAERLKLGERPTVQNRQRDVLRAAMDHELRQEASAKTPGHCSTIFERILRPIAAASRRRAGYTSGASSATMQALAKKVIADSKAVDGIQRWSQYARESSLDKATHLRNGDLGFVHPDGDTDTPTLRVDAGLFTAADQLKDGELASEPIKEGAHWAVIWRRGSMKAINRTLEQEQASIRQVLERGSVRSMHVTSCSPSCAQST